VIIAEELDEFAACKCHISLMLHSRFGVTAFGRDLL